SFQDFVLTTSVSNNSHKRIRIPNMNNIQPLPILNKNLPKCSDSSTLPSNKIVISYLFNTTTVEKSVQFPTVDPDFILESHRSLTNLTSIPLQKIDPLPIWASLHLSPKTLMLWKWLKRNN
ncbi:2405_t:CDS:2, partial [Gigaspora margarita]